MRYAPGFLDKLLQRGLDVSAAQVQPSQSLSELKDSVAMDLEALLNTRSVMSASDTQRYPLAAGSVLNFGVPDFSRFSLHSGIDRDRLCAAIREAIARQESRLCEVEVALDSQRASARRLNFVIHARLRVSLADERVRFDARFEPLLQRYSVGRDGAPVLLDAATS